MKYKIKLSLLDDEDHGFYGPGVNELLKNIKANGTVKEAAEQMGLSYSKAWRIIKEAETALGYPLIERNWGGLGGGSAKITKEGERLIEKFSTLISNVDKEASILFKEIFDEK